MLINWFISSIIENVHLNSLLNPQELKNISIQYCTHLLAAGVLRQISDKDAPLENIFKVVCTYYLQMLIILLSVSIYKHVEQTLDQSPQMIYFEPT